jgi:hypothetical protein
MVMILMTLALFATTAVLAADDLEARFLNPPEAAKPGVLWQWMGSGISREGITKDLEAIKAAGFNGTTMFNVADVVTPFAYDIPNAPTPKIVAWTDPWWKLVRFAAEESKRLGLDFGMFNGPGYEASGGAWIIPEHSMQELCASKTNVDGGRELSVELPLPDIDLRAVQPDAGPLYNPENGKLEYPVMQARKTAYRDIAVLAVRATKFVVSASSTWAGAGQDPKCAFDGNRETRWNAAGGQQPPQWLEVDFGEAKTFGKTVVREAFDRTTAYRIQAWDGASWKECAKGERLGSAKTNAFAAVTASKARLCIDAGSSDTPSIFEFEVLDPEGNNLARADGVQDVIKIGQVLDLTKCLSPEGKLTCKLPAGTWELYRLGHTTMGNGMHPSQWRARGYECDKMSREAVEFHMSHIIGEIKKNLGELIGTGFTHVHFDSYEAGMPSWTPKMREEFRARRGYDLLPFLATMVSGRIVGGSAETEKFKNDFQATILDLHRDVYFATLQKMLNDAGLVFMSEPYGGPWRQEEVMPKVDRVMTEFWTDGGKYAPFFVDSTVSAVRGSGQNIIEAEAFTGKAADSKWTETPEWLKPMGDAAFCAGINRMVLHRFTHQPWPDRYLPGQTMGLWGTHFDRTQTWWEQGKAFFTYLHRCQALLQWGAFADTKGRAAVVSENKDNHIQTTRRSDSRADVFFVANTWRASENVVCSFPVTGMQPELWDPVSAQMRELPDFRVENGATLINLKLEPAQSSFIIFRKAGAPGGMSAGNFPAYRAVSEVAGPWTVQFDPARGGPAEPVTFATLGDWTNHSLPGVKYYSGKAVYRTTFDGVSGKGYVIDLGTVKDLASVRLNGKDLGVVWCAPWRIPVPDGMLKSGANTLEITVVNGWANRLIGDEQEPADCEWIVAPGGGGAFLKQYPEWFLKGVPRPSKGRYCFTTWNYFTKDSPLISSGLLGPVRVMVME